MCFNIQYLSTIMTKNIDFYKIKFVKMVKMFVHLRRKLNEDILANFLRKSCSLLPNKQMSFNLFHLKKLLELK